MKKSLKNWSSDAQLNILNSLQMNHLLGGTGGGETDPNEEGSVPPPPPGGDN